MQIEDRVKQEINSWEIEILNLAGAPVKYTPYIKPILYGMCLDVTEKLIQNLKEISGGNINVYLSQGFNKASNRFREDYLIYHFMNNDFDFEKTKESIGSSNGGTTRKFLHRKGIIKNQADEKYAHSIAAMLMTTDQDLARMGITLLTGYQDAIAPILFKKFLQEKADKIVNRLVSIVNEIVNQEVPTAIFNETYEPATNKFEEWYIETQIQKYGRGLETAKKFELSAAALNQLLYRKRLKGYKL